MHAAGLSAKSIVNYAQLAKMVVASAVDSNGEQLFPRKWNSEFMDLPTIANQRQPTFTREVMTKIVAAASGQERMLYILLAATGLRVGEAFGLDITRHLSTDCRTLYIRQSVWEGETQQPKTPAAIRDVDLNESVATLLRQYVGVRTSGFLFVNRMGKPLSQTNVVRRSLHPILASLSVEKAGFHSFRRFRTTWLRKNRAPEDLIKYWLGHSDKTVTDAYSKVADDVDFRKEIAEKLGIGFDLPVLEAPGVQSVHNSQAEVEAVVAA